jgi:methionyl-tRNA formyltransferase
MPGRFSTTPLRVVAERHQVVGIVNGVPRRAGWLERWGLTPRSANLWIWAQTYQVPLLRLRSGKDPELVSFLEDLRPQALCVANFPHLLPPAVFERWPTLNLHPSLLPRWRGPYPWFWMYHEQELQGGWTVHRVDAGEDTGPVLLQSTYEVPFGSTVSELADAVLEPGGALLADALDGLGRLEERPQPPGEYPRARKPGPRERFVEWREWPVRRVYHFLRGVCPLWVRELEVGPFLVPEFTGWDEVSSQLAPGRLGRAEGRRYVACRDGRVFFKTRLA